ncbi:hypothetical protein Pcinc_010450 [Petrolisthes cinctipes]|uniref:Uncharacterized protein n=1 Tax=Petrolisthes cinctipes TaxID=88211 RepID=A0AAE1G2S8_PETCI|nr:hypothetical protein Pcinc_010450 [Petrolisthes cinctipes]
MPQVDPEHNLETQPRGTDNLGVIRWMAEAGIFQNIPEEESDPTTIEPEEADPVMQITRVEPEPQLGLQSQPFLDNHRPTPEREVRQAQQSFEPQTEEPT